MKVSVAENCKNFDKDYFLYVSSDYKNNQSEWDKIAFTFIFMKCKCVRGKKDFIFSGTEDYKIFKAAVIKTLGNPDGKLRGIIFDLFGSNPSTRRYYFCVSWKIFCEEIGVPYQFINTSTLKITSILFGAKKKLGNTSTFDFGKNALTLVHIKMDESSDAFDVEPNVFELEPTSDGLFIKKQVSIDLNGNDNDFKNFVLRGKKAANIIISLDDPSKKRDFQNILKPSKIVAVIDKYSNYIVDALKIMISNLYFVGQKHKIVPYFEANLWIIKKQNCFNFEGNFEIKCLKIDEIKLPFSKAVDVYVGFKENICVNFSSSYGLESMETYDLSKFEGSIIRLSLSINANGFYNFNIQKHSFLSSFLLLSQSVEKDAHVQMHLNNYGIHFTGEMGLNGDNHEDRDILSHISFFHEGFPVIGEAAKELSLEHPSFVVYDILNLARMANEGNIQINPKWGFKVEKDSTGILQIIFDTWRGKRKATPQFLLAILINHSLNTAKEFIGFRPTLFNIHIYGDFKSAEKAVIQAFKILDVQYSVKSVPVKTFIRVEKKILR
uniref:Uncharacterized protein n=1 Tax=Panagrolaimus davidi TaxID=227884 RepID=A0A914QHF4_9BILA